MKIVISPECLVEGFFPWLEKLLGIIKSALAICKRESTISHHHEFVSLGVVGRQLLTWTDWLRLHLFSYTIDLRIFQLLNLQILL